MLSTHLTALPYPKFVLIQDSVANKANTILDTLLAKNRPENRICYFIFQSSVSLTKSRHRDASCYDFTSDPRNWLNSNSPDLSSVVSGLSDLCVVVVDSLAHVLYRYGLAETYRAFAQLKNKSNVQQIITVLHTDLLEEKHKVVQCFQHLATLYMELESERVSYTYKKTSRKIIKEIEKYSFESGKFVTEAIKKPDRRVIEQTMNQTVPEDLSTFKISLSDKDKASRDELVLPYLPKDKDKDDSDGKIHYEFDAIDDWDEEDPDDDLDI